ncbi:hypothetical protein OBBRIDRAFT_181834 [Obba rivulosa]|uniref:Uncharacterized protein n=1 Tax=Obba rivulosa TaxID=1052685 RepID=A0A8E2DR19_9APHY|nr:hypothetical protein OBBRIDRAFT_181834 [Obba rivulosa]
MHSTRDRVQISCPRLLSNRCAEILRPNQALQADRVHAQRGATLRYCSLICPVLTWALLGLFSSCNISVFPVS